jgi:cyclopropane-fatty-acyl-phospholipid synthase
METDGRCTGHIANTRSNYPFNRAYMYARDAELERAEQLSHADMGG